MIAFVVSLAVEAPMMGLEKVMFGNMRKTEKAARKSYIRSISSTINTINPPPYNNAPHNTEGLAYDVYINPAIVHSVDGMTMSNRNIQAYDAGYVDQGVENGGFVTGEGEKQPSTQL